VRVAGKEVAIDPEAAQLHSPSRGLAPPGLRSTITPLAALAREPRDEVLILRLLDVACLGWRRRNR
ncbi:MAG: hypothetical protein WBX15_20305, partial [Thermoanaerobaculia bacterium]